MMSLAERILKLPIGSSVTDIEDCIRDYCRTAPDLRLQGDEIVAYVKGQLAGLQPMPRTLCIGWYTIKKLRAGETVTYDSVTLIPASDLREPHRADMCPKCGPWPCSHPGDLQCIGKPLPRDQRDPQ